MYSLIFLVYLNALVPRKPVRSCNTAFAFSTLCFSCSNVDWWKRYDAQSGEHCVSPKHSSDLTWTKIDGLHFELKISFRIELPSNYLSNGRSSFQIQRCLIRTWAFVHRISRPLKSKMKFCRKYWWRNEWWQHIRSKIRFTSYFSHKWRTKEQNFFWCSWSIVAHKNNIEF